MLQLSSRAARRLGSSYVCSSCLATSRNPLGIARTSQYAHLKRPLSSTSARGSATDTVIPKDASTPEVASDLTPDSNAPPKPAKKKPSQRKAKKDSKPPQPKHDVDRHLSVLQGALVALKNVLATQNINVGDIAKGSQKGKRASSRQAKEAGSAAEQLGTGLIQVEKLRKRLQEADHGATQKVDKPLKSRPSSAQAAEKAPPQPEKTEAVAQKSTEPAVSGTPSGTKKAAVSRLRASRQKHSVQARKRTTHKHFAAATSAHPAEATETAKSPGEQDLDVDTSKAPDISESTRTPAPPPEKHLTRNRHPLRRSSKPLPKIRKLSLDRLKLIPIDKPHPRVPSLTYGLDRVLFNQGVYNLQDPRSRVFNFDPYLSKIMPIHEFDFTALKEYVTSSKDAALISIARENHKKYTGSTSSMTSCLSHFHYLLSAWREINTQMLSQEFVPESVQFTRLSRAPAATFLHWKDGVYAIDADKEYDTANILSMLGKSMEKLLTLEKDDYERYRKVNSDQISEEERNADEAFHYTSFGDFLMRSQLDAHDSRVPGTGMFDLKTRAVVSIRMDTQAWQKGTGYELRKRMGQWLSFEREYYDMIRSAFLKYSLQVRMGRMDGIFVAYHNTQRIFGFQYISIEEMDKAIHGTARTTLGNGEFKFSLALLNQLLDRATRKFPKQSLRLHFETRRSEKAPFMYFFAKPVTADEIREVQEAGKAAIQEFEQTVLRIEKDEEEEVDEETDSIDNAAMSERDEDFEEEDLDEMTPSGTSQETSDTMTWEEVRHVVEDAIDDDELGLGVVREAIEDALEDSGLLEAQTPEQSRAYVDALLKAVTGRSVSHKTSISSAHEPRSEDQPHHDMVPDQQLLNDSALGQEIQINDHVQDAEATADEIPEQLYLDKSASDDGEPLPPVTEGEEVSVDETPAKLADSERLPSEELADDYETAEVANDETSGSTAEDVSAASEVGVKSEISAQEIIEEEDAAEDEADHASSEAEEDETQRDDASPSSSMSTLKRLFTRMARRIEQHNLSEHQADDTSKLAEFERVLGSMIAQTKGISPQQDAQSSEERQSEVEDLQESSIEAPKEVEEQEAVPASIPTPQTTTVGDDVLGLVLTIRNKVDGTYVTRPEGLWADSKWEVEYNIEELASERAQALYAQCKNRRKTIYDQTRDRERAWYGAWRGELKRKSHLIRKWRLREDQRLKRSPIYVLGEPGFRTYDEVFGADPQEAVGGQQKPDEEEAREKEGRAS